MPHPTLQSIALIATITTCAHAQPTRDISVTITARTHEGQPLADIPIQLLNTPDRPAGKTGVDGTLTLTATVPVDTAKVTVWVFGGGGGKFTREEEKVLIARMRELRGDYSIQGYDDVPLLEGVEAYESEIVAWPGVSVSGVVTLPNGSPLGSAVVSAIGGEPMAVTSAAGAFSLHGLRGCTPAVIQVSSEWAMHIFELPAEDVQDGFNMGRVVVPATPTVSGAMSGTIVGSEAWRDLDERGGGTPGFALVAPDGSFIYDIRAGRVVSEEPTGFAIEAPPLVDQVWAPVGEFYVTPGWLSRSREIAALIKALRAGQDLSTSAIPRVTIRAGQNTQITVNLGEALQALRSAVTVESD